MFSAIGFTAGPQYPPCELLPSTFGRGSKVSRSIPVIELIVLIARKPIRVRALGRPRHHADVGDVRRQLHQHRRPRRLLHPLRNHLRVLRHLAHGRAHPALAHAMRTAEVQLQPIRARTLRALHHLVPGLALRLHHQRRNHRMLRIQPLHLGDLAQVHLDGPVADQLNIVQPHHALPRSNRRTSSAS